MIVWTINFSIMTHEDTFNQWQCHICYLFTPIDTTHKTSDYGQTALSVGKKMTGWQQPCSQWQALISWKTVHPITNTVVSVQKRSPSPWRWHIPGLGFKGSIWLGPICRRWKTLRTSSHLFAKQTANKLASRKARHVHIVQVLLRKVFA